MKKGILFLTIVFVLAVIFATVFYLLSQFWLTGADYFTAKSGATEGSVENSSKKEPVQNFPQATGDIDDTTDKIISSFDREDSFLYQESPGSAISNSLQAAGEFEQSYNGDEF